MYNTIRSIDRQFVSGTKNDIYKKAAVLTTDCYSKQVNTLMPTLVQSKLVKFEGSALHELEKNAEFAISPKKIISSMLATIPVINKKLRCIFSLPLLSPLTVNTVTHSYGTLALLQLLLLAKDRRNQQVFSV